MGKVVKKIFKVAAFVAIAAFAAPVAAAIGFSGAVGTIAGSALVGAAAGAATNAVAGGGILNGALMGGLAGGIGGVGKVISTPASAASGATGAAPAAASTPVATSAEGVFSGGLSPSAIAGATDFSGLAASAAPVSFAGGLSGGAATLAGATDFSGLASAVAPSAPAAITPSAISGATDFSGMATVDPTVFANATLPASAVSGALDFSTMPVVDPSVFASNATGTGATAAGGAAANAPAKAGLLGTAGNVVGDVAKAVAPTLLAGAITGNPQNDILNQEEDALKKAQEQYNNNFNLKTGYAQGLIDDANQYDPAGAGRRAAEAARIRASLAGRNAARDANADKAEVIQRQAEIEGGRQAGADYWNAYGTTGAQRIQTKEAGLREIPLGQRPSSADYTTAYNAAGQNTKGVADLIGTGLGAATAGLMGDTEEERRRLAAA